MSMEYKCPKCNEITTFNDRVCNKCGEELTREEIEKVWELARWEKNLKMHQKDQITCLLIGVISTIFVVLFWFIDGLAFLSVLFLFGSFIGFYFLYFAVKGENDATIVIQAINSDYEQFKKDQESYRKQLHAKALQERNINHPVCPICGSRETQRITTANRVASVSMVGLASSKIGKQYECKKCKHKW